ncbi:hypothetical protein [uncultured Winogradskyella sp.]|uniref:hypothetical protein n=1 Tax=uncultured Winogradskyella sp. TaxID=395353 RepID=UPI00261C9681|nr:hypothetical protein [uncultured Winogradskyella sp.]
MNRKPLSSFLGQAFAFMSYYFMVFAFGIIIYSILVKDWSGLIAGIVFGVFNYIIFGRKLLRTKSITFDENFFYFKDDSKIELSQIQNIENGKIEYFYNGSEKVIFVNPFFPSTNHKLFNKYFKLKK